MPQRRSNISAIRADCFQGALDIIDRGGRDPIASHPTSPPPGCAVADTAPRGNSALLRKGETSNVSNRPQLPPGPRRPVTLALGRDAVTRRSLTRATYTMRFVHALSPAAHLIHHSRLESVRRSNAVGGAEGVALIFQDLNRRAATREPMVSLTGGHMMLTADRIRIVPKTADAAVARGLLEHLIDLKGYVIADPAPDIRGWKVELPDQRAVGTLDDLIVDTTDLSVRYVEVKVDHRVLGTTDDEWVLVPVQRAQIDDREHHVIIDRLPATGLAAAPRFSRGVPTKSQEQQIQEYFGIDIMGELIRNELPANDEPII